MLESTTILKKYFEKVFEEVGIEWTAVNDEDMNKLDEAIKRDVIISTLEHLKKENDAQGN